MFATWGIFENIVMLKFGHNSIRDNKVIHDCFANPINPVLSGQIKVTTCRAHLPTYACTSHANLVCSLC